MNDTELTSLIKTIVIAAAAVGIIMTILRVGEWKGNVNADRKNFNKFMDEVRGDIKEILQRLSPASTPSAIGKKSPLQLTDLGKEISDELKALEWAKEIKPLVLSEIDKAHGLEGAQPYEIQEYCFDFTTKIFIFPDDMDKKVQDSAYKRGLTKRQVLEVLAVELRDELLRELKLDIA